MKASITYSRSLTTASQIAMHLAACDAHFQPPLSGRVIVGDYAEKLAARAVRFEAWSGDSLIGLVAVYGNEAPSPAYITNVSVLPGWTGRGIATHLLRAAIAYSGVNHFPRLRLEVAAAHAAAIRLYERCGFTMEDNRGQLVGMVLDLAGERAHESGT